MSESEQMATMECDRVARVHGSSEEAKEGAVAFLDAVSQLADEMGVRGVACAVAMQFDAGVEHGVMVHVGAKIEAEARVGMGLVMALAKCQAAGGAMGCEPAAGGLIQ